jgi:hypothetical protein
MTAIHILINLRAELTALMTTPNAIRVNAIAYAMHGPMLKAIAAQRNILNMKMRDIAQHGSYYILSTERHYDTHGGSYNLFEFSSLEEEEKSYDDSCGWEWEVTFQYLSFDEAAKVKEQMKQDVDQIVII